MIFKKKNGNPYPVQIELGSTSEPITIYACDETTGGLITATWYLSAVDRGSASRPGSLNQPVVNGYANVGIDPTDPLQVQAASTAVTGTSVIFYPSNANQRNASAKARLVATSGAQVREMLINV